MVRYAFLFVILSLLLGCGGACAPTSQDVNIGTAEGSETRVYEVFGMDCPGCHGGLEKLVKKIPTIQQAQANWERKQLVVSIRPGAELNDEDIHDAIRRANFTAGKRIR